MANHKKNIIHYVCGAYPFDFGGVARFDSLLQEVFPKRIFMKAQEESQRLYTFCLENPLTTLVITDNQHACDVPQNIPCIVFHHGIARTHAERDPSWNKQVRDLCVNGQDQMFEHRLPHNTIFISISQFCSDEFQRHYGKTYDRFRRFLLHVPIEHRISSEWSLKKTPSNTYAFEDPYNLSTKGAKPRILGDWSTVNKGSDIIPKLQAILKDEFEFVQLKTKPTQDIEQHRKNVAAFYTSSQMYFQISTSEGSSFASEDGLAYGLLTIASNVGQFYETPNHVASTFDWKQRTNVEYLAEKIRTTWAARDTYNPVEWMRENLDWIQWSSRLTDIVRNFIAALDIRILSYPVVQRNASIFWQHPVITEKYCLDRISQQPIHKDIYVGIPYATLIDKNVLPFQELLSIGNQIKVIQAISPKGTRVYTTCQHIHYSKMLEVMKMIGITDVFISHKRKGQQSMEHGMNMHGLPLYPVNVFDEKRSVGIPRESNQHRDYLFSFIGAHMKHYLHPIRQKLLSWASHASKEFYIQDTHMWHFEKNVYQDQVSGIKLSSADLSQQDTQTLSYNRTLVNSTFSLCPVGAGPNTIRLWESICVQSIPVIIADEFSIEECIPKHALPAEPFYIQLPYASPHLNSPEALVTYLNTISQEQIQNMRKGCEQVTTYLQKTFISPPSFA